MKNNTIVYRRQQASREAILAHLRACSDRFVPPLDERVELATYAAKIADHARTFEAWSGKVLVGLLAAYLDGGRDNSAFITNVSVLADWAGQGVASRLLAYCVDEARVRGLAAIALEVGAGNAPALAFYRRHGFVVVTPVEDRLVMRRPLQPGNNDDRRPQ